MADYLGDKKMSFFLKCPAGATFPFIGTTAPNGWLLCDGSPVSRTKYPELFAVIGIAYGDGSQNADGTNSTFINTHFNLPDMRGRFIRGRANTSANDPDRNSRSAHLAGGNSGDNVGSIQTEEISGHDHGSTNYPTSNNPTWESVPTDSHLHNTSNYDMNHRHYGYENIYHYHRHNVQTPIYSGFAPWGGGPRTCWETYTIRQVMTDTRQHPNHPSSWISSAETNHYHDDLATTGSLSHSHGLSVSLANSGSTENRPLNINVNYIIKI